ncbi:MAG TPA: GNAT family N-acetyltransferase [Halobacteria archaeon]|jgi:precorrin-6B methylase 2/GNAT superfamily N-acetyltransferase|nr:GNAT family N-acetyltransferase [Halobacteria archaeon]
MYDDIEDLKVELLNEKDADEIVYVYKSVWSTAERYPLEWRMYRQYTREQVLSDMREGYYYFGVRKDGKLIGCYKAIITEKGCFGEQQAVLPEYRNTGAAQAMYEQFINFAKEKGCKRNYVNVLANDPVCDRILKKYDFERWGEPYEQTKGMLVQMYERKVNKKETKDEIIGILINKFDPIPNEVFVDIGCGSGKVSLSMSKYFNKVYSVDLDKTAIKDLDKIKTDNMELLCMDGIKFLEEYDYDKVFVGGTKNYEKMIDAAADKAKKIIFNVARLGVASRIVDKMNEKGVFDEILMINISKSYSLVEDIAFHPINPIFMIIGSKKC